MEDLGGKSFTLDDCRIEVGKGDDVKIMEGSVTVYIDTGLVDITVEKGPNADRTVITHISNCVIID